MGNANKGLLVVGVVALLAFFLTKKPPNPPAFTYEVIDLSLSPAEVQPGGAVTITVVVRNTSNVAGTATVNLTGDFTGSKNVALPAQLNATAEAVFMVTATGVGTYTVSTDGRSASFECISAAPAMSLLSATSSPNPTAVNSNETITLRIKNNSNSPIHAIVYIGIRGNDNASGPHPEYNPGLVFAAWETKTITCVLQNYWNPGTEKVTIMVWDSPYTQTFISTFGQEYQVV